MASHRESIIEAPTPPSRQFTLVLPKDVPIGSPVKVVVQTETIQAEGIEVNIELGEVTLIAGTSPINPERELLREQMAAAGLLDTSYILPLNAQIPTDEEVWAAAERTAALGGRSMEELIDEDRGEW